MIASRTAPRVLEGPPGASNFRFAALQSDLRVNLALPLLVGFPVGFLERDLVVLGGWLDGAVGVDCPRDQRVLAGRNFAQVDVEENPRVRRPRLFGERGGLPFAVIKLNFD